MNAEEIKRLKEKIKEIENIDFNSIVSEMYPKEDISIIILTAGFSVKQTIIFLRRLLIQFDSILDTGDANIIPIVFTFNEYDSPSGQGNIFDSLEGIRTRLLEKNLDEVSKMVRWLIAYQMNFGFWNQSEKKIHDVDTLTLLEKKGEIELLLSQVESLKSQFNNVISELDKEKNSLIELVKIKNDELQTISNTLGKVTNEAEQINSFWQNATKFDSDINAIKSNWNALFEETKDQKNKQQFDFNELIRLNEGKISELESLQKQLEEKNQSFDSQLGYIESKKSFIEEKEKEIIKLTGFAADGSLGHTFSSRQAQIGKQVMFWTIAIPIMTVLCLTWVFLIFYYSSDYSNYWINTLINSIKTIPAFILLYFVIRQYSKERNLQEEYAFKASVAMTLKAYSDQLGTESDVEKRKMLMDAIEKLYSAPKITVENASIFTLRSKSLNDTLKSLLEFLQQTIKR